MTWLPSDDVSKPANLPQSRESSGILLVMPLESASIVTDTLCVPVNTLTLLSST